MASLRPSEGRSRAWRWILALTGLVALGASTALSPGPLLGGLTVSGTEAEGVASSLRGSAGADRAGVTPSRSRSQEALPEGPDLAGPELPGAGAPPMALWELSGDSVHAFDHPIGDHRPERHALRLDPSRAQELSVGDRIALPLPGLGTLVATIEHAWNTPLGNRGLTGSIEGLDPAYAVTLTQGHTTLFGRITTPYGNYLLEGTGGAAAIHLDDLDRLIDPDQTDERIPPEAGEEPV